VAKARHVSPDQIRAVLAHYRSGRDLGFLGEPTVNVLQLNLQLDHQYPVTS
jgi:potassium-transporting ATPase KdpC subunit